VKRGKFLSVRRSLSCLRSPREWMRGFHDQLKIRPSFRFVLLEWSSNWVASMMSRSIYLSQIWKRGVVMWWLWLNPCSATVGLRWCSFTLLWMDQPICPMYAWPDLLGMLYTTGVFSPRSSFRGERKLETSCVSGQHLMCVVSRLPVRHIRLPQPEDWR
jgi:hypothetical protein